MFRSINKSYYRNVQGVALVFDVTNTDSFHSLESWLSEFIQKQGQTELSDIIFVLIGNKADLKEQQVVCDEEALKWCAIQSE